MPRSTRRPPRSRASWPRTRRCGPATPASPLAELAALDALGVHGPAVEADRSAIRAGIAALEGRLPEAVSAYRTTIAAWQSLDLPWDEALTVIEMAQLLGPALPEVQAAAAVAREILLRLGARPFLAQLDAILAADPGEADGRPERPATAQVLGSPEPTRSA